jgi:protein required for attachment to host cells
MEEQTNVEEMARIWVVVADSSKARFFEAESHFGGLRELGGMKHGSARAPGLNGTRRDGPGTEMELNDHEAKFFAREVANRLELEGQQGSFNRLVIAAAPQFLTYLRAYLSSRVRELVAEELAADLVDVSPDKVRRSLPPSL